EPIVIETLSAADQEALPVEPFGMIAAEDEPHNLRIHVRGNHLNPGAEVPRGFLHVLAGDKPYSNGSGRLELAEALFSPDHPLPQEVAPANRLLSHMPVRRLEGETLRDAILAASGSLDATAYGPSVRPHISPYQDGRGKPESGPLDGAGRRSVYLEVRRNFITPLFLAFDYPLPSTTVGRRSVSTVPSQALMLMNNDFVAVESSIWAARALRVIKIR